MNPPTEQPIAETQAAPALAKVRQVLTAIISELCEVNPTQIKSDFALTYGRLHSSLGRATLDAKIRRRLGVKLENLHTFRTVGELEAALVGNHLPASAPTPQIRIDPPAELVLSTPPSKVSRFVTVAPAGLELACGIDVELVSALLEAKDYWEEPFYQTHFTVAEIAYCVSQPNPRMHFAARWCAKEALKKCLPEYLLSEMNKIEVVRRETGSPCLQVLANEGARILPVALSLTHNADWALAIVVSGRQTLPAIRPDPSGAAKDGRVVLALSLAAFVISILALILALVHR
jgi:phosphopantetheine--protein transferase-like protein